MYPNSALSAWQLAVMAVIPVAALAAWLTAIFLAAREARRDRAAAAPQAETTLRPVARATTFAADEPEPSRGAARQKAA